MDTRERYVPGPATGADVLKQGDQWTLVLVRELAHPRERVWRALTDPAHLREWAPFDASRNLGSVGTVTLTTVGTPAPQAAESHVTRAEEPARLEFDWGGQELRWELQPSAGGGTRLTLWHNIDRRFIAMGAAGWHICLDVLDRSLGDHPIGRMVGADALKFGGWQRLNTEYARQFGVESPAWPAAGGAS